MGSKRGFILYFDYREHLALLNDDERGKLLMALFDYGELGIIPELNGATRMAFSFVRAQMERDQEKYIATCDRNKNNGAKGGRPIKAKETDPNQRKPEITGRFSEKPKKADTENDTDTDIDTDNDKKKQGKTFVPPTLLEVKTYCDCRNSSVDPVKFYDYFNAGNWIDSKGQSVKNWKQKIITWEGNHGKNLRDYKPNVPKRKLAAAVDA